MSAPMIRIFPRQCVLRFLQSRWSQSQSRSIYLWRPTYTQTLFGFTQNICWRKTLILARHLYISKKDVLSKTSEVDHIKPDEIVQLFDSSNKLVWKMSLASAKEKARTENMKLLYIGKNPDSVSSFKYLSGQELHREKRKIKEESKKTKGTKIHVIDIFLKIEENDFNRKLEQAVKFLKKGQGVKILIRGSKYMEEGEVNRKRSELDKKVRHRLEDVGTINTAVKEATTLTLTVKPLEENNQKEE